MSPLIKRLVVGFVVLLAVVLGGGLGYYVLGEGQWSFNDCVYMTVITITTVGYGETLVGMDVVTGARGFTILLLVFGTGSIVYFASTITAFIIEGELKDVLFASKLKKRMKRMKDHIVVCGAGHTGRNIIEEMLKIGRSVIAVDTNEHELKEIADKYPKADFTYFVGDATDDDVISNVNLANASGMVAALASDKDNLYLVVSARQGNPNLRIVSRCAEVANIGKLKRSGADAVVSPNFIGGMRMVSEMVRPAVVRFLDDMLRDKRAAYRIEEVKLGEKVAGVGATLEDAKIRERFGMSVLAMSASDTAAWTYNPDGSEKIAPGMTLVVLGSAEQVSRMRAEIG